MQKRAFTLIEMIISIIILSLIVMFLYAGLNSLEKSSTFLQNFTKEDRLNSRVKKLFILDILQSQDINITRVNKKIDTISFISNNSLHNTPLSKITYAVNSNKELVRLEGQNYKLPLKQEQIYSINFDIILRDIEYFRIYQNQKNSTILFVIKQKNKDFKYLEMLAFE